MIYSSGFDRIPFQNSAKERLRQTYAVVYFLINGSDGRDAIRKTSACFPKIHDLYQTIESKISTQIGVSTNTFFSWYDNGILLRELSNRLRLNEHDQAIFADLIKKNFWEALPLAEEVEPNCIPLTEGAVKTIAINAYERNAEARRICISHYGSICYLCKFNFEAIYGVAGKGYIHVHHLKRISEIRENYVIDPIRDLRPICPNCHAMIHSRIPPFTIEEMISMLNICT